MTPRRAFTALGSRAAGSLSQLLSAALVGQAFGVNALGALTSLVYLSTFGAQFLSCGLPGYALSNISRTPSVRHKGLLVRAYLRRSILPILACAGFVALCFYVYTHLALQEGSEAELTFVDFAYFAPLFLCSFSYAFGKVVFESLKASGKSNRALLFEYSVPQLMVVLMVVASTATLISSPQYYVTWSYTFGLFIAVVLGLWLVSRDHVAAASAAKPASPGNTTRGSLSMRRPELLMVWASAALGALSTAVPYLAWSIFGGTSEEGLFAIAHRVVGVSATIQLAVAAAYAPALALLRARGNFVQYYGSLKTGTLWIVLPSSGFLAVAFLFSAEIFGLFGSPQPPQAALDAMTILIAARAISSVTGLAEASFIVSGRVYADLFGLLASISAFAVTLALRDDHSLVGISFAFAISWVVRSACSLGFTYIFYCRDRTPPSCLCNPR